MKRTISLFFFSLSLSSDAVKCSPLCRRPLIFLRPANSSLSLSALLRSVMHLVSIPTGLQDKRDSTVRRLEKGFEEFSINCEAAAMPGLPT